MKKVFLIFTAALLASCTPHVPVTGITSKSERFDGTATRLHHSTSGILKVTSNKGVTCTGKFDYLEGGVSGFGKFDCTDGRTGAYTFQVTGNEGYGIGETSTGEKIEFYFNKQK